MQRYEPRKFVQTSSRPLQMWGVSLHSSISRRKLHQVNNIKNQFFNHPTFTWSWISSNSVSFTASTSIRSWNILTNSNTKLVSLVNFTLIDIIACSIVGVELETRFAACKVGYHWVESSNLTKKCISNRICSFPNSWYNGVGKVLDILGTHRHPRTFCRRSIHFWIPLCSDNDTSQ